MVRSGGYLLWKGNFWVVHRSGHLQCHTQHGRHSRHIKWRRCLCCHKESTYFLITDYAWIKIATTRSWRQLLSKNERSLDLTSIYQGPDKTFWNFMASLLQATGRIINNTDAGKLIIQQLAFQNANKLYKEALQAYKNWVTLSEIIQNCIDIGFSCIQGAALKQLSLKLLIHGLKEKERRMSHFFSCRCKGLFPEIAVAPEGRAQPLTTLLWKVSVFKSQRKKQKYVLIIHKGFCFSQILLVRHLC